MNNFIIFLITGSLVLLAFLAITNPLRVNRSANTWFGCFLLSWSTYWLDEVLDAAQIDHSNLYFTLSIKFIQFFTPIIFYKSVVYFVYPGHRLSLKDTWFLIVPFCLLGISLWQLYRPELSGFSIAYNLLILIHSLTLIATSYYLIRKHQRHIQLFSSNIEGINLNWLEFIAVFILSTTILFTGYHIFFNPFNLNVYINSIFLCAIFLVANHLFKQKEIFPVKQQELEALMEIEEEADELPEAKKKLFSDDELLQQKQRLQILMADEKPYLDSELNLIKLATLLALSPHQLSYIINNGFNENFFRYVNKYRVEKAQQLLIDTKFDNLSILGIAFESGFNSKTSFNTTFKKITGTTPSEFKKTRSNS